jgi:hypothetical protein
VSARRGADDADAARVELEARRTGCGPALSGTRRSISSGFPPGLAYSMASYVVNGAAEAEVASNRARRNRDIPRGKQRQRGRKFRVLLDQQ